LGAFTRQIEIDPFHESAYEWRAYVLERLHRWDEAERDLLKQIEVTPFKAWSYEKLAQRRMAQRRFRDAAEYYSRAAAVEPKEPKRWVDLAWAHGKEGRAEEARTALDRARALFLPDWLKVRAGLVHDAIGDPRKAGELGASGIPTIAERLAGLTVESFGEGDVYWVERLSEAWYLVGAAARADGDDARAERYLEAAWKLTLLPQAAWALGDLREKQGRLAEAVDLWSMASFVPAAEGRLPEDRQGRIEAACRRLGEAPPSVPPEYAKLPPEAQALLRRNSRQIAAAKTFLQLRHVRLGEAVHGDMREPVLLLTRADGRVERVRALSPEHAADVDRQLAEAGPLRLDVLSPEDRGFKVVRRGELACSRTRCSIILGLPAVDPQSGVVQFDSEADIEVEGETGSQ
jgi:tetratricopeptide (TPR) repeat protein